jgi:hypothetical protein
MRKAWKSRHATSVLPLSFSTTIPGWMAGVKAWKPAPWHLPHLSQISMDDRLERNKVTPTAFLLAAGSGP